MNPEIVNTRYQSLVGTLENALVRKLRVEAALRMAKLEGNRRAERDNDLKIAKLLDEIDITCVDISREWGAGLLNRVRREADERARVAFAKEQARWGSVEG